MQRPSPPLTLRNAPGMVVAGKDVMSPSRAASWWLVQLANGAPRWEAAVGEPRGATELERVTDMAACRW